MAFTVRTSDNGFIAKFFIRRTLFRTSIGRFQLIESQRQDFWGQHWRFFALLVVAIDVRVSSALIDFVFLAKKVFLKIKLT